MRGVTANAPVTRHFRGQAAIFGSATTHTPGSGLTSGEVISHRDAHPEGIISPHPEGTTRSAHPEGTIALYEPLQPVHVCLAILGKPCHQICMTHTWPRAPNALARVSNHWGRDTLTLTTPWGSCTHWCCRWRLAGAKDQTLRQEACVRTHLRVAVSATCEVWNDVERSVG